MMSQEGERKDSLRLKSFSVQELERHYGDSWPVVAHALVSRQIPVKVTPASTLNSVQDLKAHLCVNDGIFVENFAGRIVFEWNKPPYVIDKLVDLASPRKVDLETESLLYSQSSPATDVSTWRHKSVMNVPAISCKDPYFTSPHACDPSPAITSRKVRPVRKMISISYKTPALSDNLSGSRKRARASTPLPPPGSRTKDQVNVQSSVQVESPHHSINLSDNPSGSRKRARASTPSPPSGSRTKDQVKVQSSVQVENPHHSINLSDNPSGSRKGARASTPSPPPGSRTKDQVKVQSSVPVESPHHSINPFTTKQKTLEGKPPESGRFPDSDFTPAGTVLKTAEIAFKTLKKMTDTIVKKAKYGNVPNGHDIDIANTFFLLHFTKNAYKSGVYANAKLSAFTSLQHVVPEKFESTYYRYLVAKEQTSTVRISFNEDEWRMLEMYVKYIRPVPLEAYKQYLFINFYGRNVCKPCLVLQKVLKQQNLCRFSAFQVLQAIESVMSGSYNYLVECFFRSQGESDAYIKRDNRNYKLIYYKESLDRVRTIFKKLNEMLATCY